MDCAFKITYFDGNDECLTQANSRDEAEMVAANLVDDGYINIKIEMVRI